MLGKYSEQNARYSSSHTATVAAFIQYETFLGGSNTSCANKPDLVLSEHAQKTIRAHRH